MLDLRIDTQNFDFESLYIENNIMFADIEILEDYFSFAFHIAAGKEMLKAEKEFNINLTKRNTKIGIVYKFECFSDIDMLRFKKFYLKYIRNVLKANAAYFYNSDYDESILDILLKLIDSKQTAIIKKLRKANDYIIRNHSYKKLKTVYRNLFFETGSVKKSKDTLVSSLINESEKDFFLEYFDTVFKNIRNLACGPYNKRELIILDIGKSNLDGLLYDKNSLKLKYSLKDIQLYDLKKRLEFDFNTYPSYQKIVGAGKEKYFDDYIYYDIESLVTVYKNYVEDFNKSRFYAIQTVKSMGFKADYDINLIFSDSNTPLIEKLLLKEKSCKEKEFKLPDYIKCDFPKFNKWIEFVDNNPGKNFNQLQIDFKDTYGEDTIIVVDGLEFKMGLGGAHSAKSGIFNGCYNIDYFSHYPSIVIQNKDLFGSIINMEMFEAIYNKRLQLKQSGIKNETVTGLKLIMNSLTGILGLSYLDLQKYNQLITLSGQAMILNLINRYDLNPVNANTDGITFLNKIDHQKLIAEDFKAHGSKYMMLEFNDYSNCTLVQKAVNDYVLYTDKEVIKRKGKYKRANFAQQYNFKDNYIQQNLHNAINLLTDKEIEILPLYFKNTSNIKWSCDTSYEYYITDNNNGKALYKKLTHSNKALTVNGEQIYITTKPEHASKELYLKFAEYTKNNLINAVSKSEEVEYFEYEITKDTDSNNKIKRAEQKKLRKLLGVKHLEYAGFKGDVKSNTSNNKKLKNYTKTQLLESTDTLSFKIKCNDDKFAAIDIDVKSVTDIKEILNLKDTNTFRCWNDRTVDIGRCKLVFKNDTNKIYEVNDKYKDTIDLPGDIVVWSIDNKLTRKYDHNNTHPSDLSNFPEIIDTFLQVKAEDAKEYIENRKEFGGFTGNDKLIKICTEFIRNQNIEIFDIAKDENGVHYRTNCPFCESKRNEHYKRNLSKKGDSYINIYEYNNKYNINVQFNSESCKQDKEHVQYVKCLRTLFNQTCPTTRQIKNEQLFLDIKDNIDIKFDDNFFLENGLKVIATGTGKTYQSALRLVYNVFVSNTFTIYSTKINRNLDTVSDYIFEIIDKCVANKTKVISDWLSSNDKKVSDMNICELTLISQLPPYIVDLKAVVTTHVYYYSKGHDSNYNHSILRLKDEKINSTSEVINDEYESYKNNSIKLIPLNGFLNYHFEQNKNTKQYKPTRKCIFKADKKVKLKEPETFEHAKEINKQNYVPNDIGVWTYQNDQNGELNLKAELEKYTTITKNTTYDYDDTIKPIALKGTEYSYILVNQLIELKVDKRAIELLEEHNNFLNLIKKCKSVYISKKIVKIGKSPTAKKLKSYEDRVKELEHEQDYETKNKFVKNFLDGFGTDFNNLDELFSFGKQHLRNDFEAVKRTLTAKDNANDLYHENLVCLYPSILDAIKCNKYYLTANDIDDKTLKIDNSMVFTTTKALETVNFISIYKQRKIDSLIYECINNEKLKNTYLEHLIFVNSQSSLKTRLNSRSITPNYVLKSTDTMEGLKNCGQVLDDKENIKDYNRKNGHISYLNGAETQGTNYSDCEFMILNTNVSCNYLGRLIETNNHKLAIKDIHTTRVEKTNQATGRIYRGDIKNKMVFMIGGNEVINRVIKYQSNYSFNAVHTNIDKNITHTSDKEKILNETIEFILNKLHNLNHNGGEVVNDPSIDKRNIKKLNYTTIREQFIIAENEYLKKNHKKKKLTLREAEKLLKIPMKTISRALKT